MEEFAFSRHDLGGRKIATNAVVWRDLRDWLALVDAAGGLRRISATVDPVEELAAITFLAGRTVEAPALLFDRLCGDEFGIRVLSNMLGASKERYALAVGLDPALSICETIAATRAIMRRRIAPAYVDKGSAPRRSTRSFCAASRSTSPGFQRRNSGLATVDAISAPAM